MSELKKWQPQPDIWDTFKNTGELLFKPNILITKPSPMYVSPILDLLQGAMDGVQEKALLDVTPDEILETIARGQALMAVDLERDEIIGYQGMNEWPQYNLFEPRSAKVHLAWRGQHINTVMKQLAFQTAHEQRPSWSFMGFTEAESKSRGILEKAGFEMVSMAQVKDELPDLANPCPANCFVKNGHACGCQVYILNPNEK